MTYTIGSRRITLAGDVDDATVAFLELHPEMFKYCLNSASYQFLVDLKKIIHLYGDVLTIYGTLLRKIPKYDDISSFTARTQSRILRLEDLFNSLLGRQINGDPKNKLDWDDRLYEHDIRRVCTLCIQLLLEVFKLAISCLNCIEVFFQNFDNLKKLLIPYFYVQTETIYALLTRLLDLFKVATIVDDLSLIRNITPVTLQQLRKIERITTGIERELTYLAATFRTFNLLLYQYTSLLLGKAILKMDVDLASCELVKRRDICFLAAEQVVNIPLRHEEAGLTLLKKLQRYITILLVFCGLLLLIMTYKLFRLFWG